MHQALSYNATSESYLFSNVRYARAPVGELRFRAPHHPAPSQGRVKNGSEPKTCPQGLPDWQTRFALPEALFLNGEPYSLEAYEANVPNATVPPLPDFNQNATEDCLFLDVHVPRKVLVASEQRGYTGAPVLVWIHGGGYVTGSKTGVSAPFNEPTGLLQRSQQGDQDGLIFVAINYRLGAFGWLAGPEVEHDGHQNAGLLDQRFALEWVQQNIHLFGGCPDRVTVIGESAGAGSVALQTTAFGGAKGRVPFSQAITQSVGFAPTLSQPPSTYSGLLSRLNVTTLADVRKLPLKALIQANADQIKAAPASTFLYGPVIDHKFVPATSSQLLRQGAFDKSVKVLVGRNLFEGGIFYDPSVHDDAGFRGYIETSVPGLSPAQYSFLVEELYPARFDGSVGYTDQVTRQTSLFGDSFFDCNGLALNQALGARSYAYEFAIAPGFHGQDLFYTFDNPSPRPNPSFVPRAQATLQQLIVSFAMRGAPSTGGGEALPAWDQRQLLLNITSDRDRVAPIAINMTRCAWWQENV